MVSPRRQNDFLIKWVLGIVSSIAILFVGQFIFLMQSNAAMEERVRINTADISELKTSSKKMIRVEVIGEMTLNKVNEIAGTIKVIGNDTRNNTNNIKQFKIHISDHTMATK